MIIAKIGVIAKRSGAMLAATRVIGAGLLVWASSLAIWQQAILSNDRALAQLAHAAPVETISSLRESD